VAGIGLLEFVVIGSQWRAVVGRARCTRSAHIWRAHHMQCTMFMFMFMFMIMFMFMFMFMFMCMPSCACRLFITLKKVAANAHP
jgi:hypothetical protein